MNTPDHTPPKSETFEDQIQYLVQRTRRISLTEGWDPEKSSVQIDKPGESPFKGISKAKTIRPLEHASQGLVSVEVELRDYETKKFPAPSLAEAISKAVAFIRSLESDAADAEGD